LKAGEIMAEKLCVECGEENYSEHDICEQCQQNLGINIRDEELEERRLTKSCRESYSS